MKDHSEHPYIGLVGAAIFLFLGIRLAFWPHKEQERMLQYYQRNPKEQDIWFGWHYNRVKSSAYVRELRVMGIVMIAAVLFVLYVLIFNHDPLPTW